MYVQLDLHLLHQMIFKRLFKEFFTNDEQKEKSHIEYKYQNSIFLNINTISKTH